MKAVPQVVPISQALAQNQEERQALASLLGSDGWRYVQDAVMRQAESLLIKAVGAGDAHSQTKALAAHALAADLANYVTRRIEELDRMIQASGQVARVDLNR